MIGSSQRIAELCRRWQTKVPEAAIVEAVKSAFPQLKQLPPPIQIRPLALARNITRIVPARLNVDGIISSTDAGTFTIQVNQQHSEVRRRFTCAHEIAHTFFFELDSSRQKMRVRVQDDSLEDLPQGRYEEYLCNVAAAEILMPYKQFSDHLRQLGVGAAPLMRLASRFKVSLHTAARRTVQLSPFKLAIVLWKQECANTCYRSLWEVGRVSKLAFEEPLLINRRDPMFKLFTEKKRFTQRTWVSLGGPLQKYFVDGVSFPSGGERRILTVFIMESFARALVSQASTPVRDFEQLPLF